MVISFVDCRGRRREMALHPSAKSFLLFVACMWGSAMDRQCSVMRARESYREAYRCVLARRRCVLRSVVMVACLVLANCLLAL